jgi:GNAT superfamily N-acetyltransferase
MTESRVFLSAADSARFGVTIARAPNIDASTLPGILEYCYAKHVDMLIARTLVTHHSSAQEMERSGFRLMDTLVYYARDLTKTPLPTDPNATRVRPIAPGEEETVAALSALAFAGYKGHYHADPLLDKAKCDEGYREWASLSCTDRKTANEVLAAFDGERMIAFATLRANSPEEGEGVLFGVHPDAQGRGMYRALMIGGMEWCAGRGHTRMIVSTQIDNLAVQKVWVRLGFEPSRAYYTFHKWFHQT